MPGAVDVEADVLATIWELPDELWGRVEPILKRRYPAARTGRPRADLRRVLDGVIFRMRSGCQWNRMPKPYGDDAPCTAGSNGSSAMACWRDLGAAGARVRRAGRRRLALAGRRRVHGQVPLKRRKKGPNPTDRAKSGTKKSVVVEADGGQLVSRSPAPTSTTPSFCKRRSRHHGGSPDPAKVEQHLCLDKAYDNPTGHPPPQLPANAAHRRIGEEKLDPTGAKTHPARRWVVERTLAWLQKCRAILIRYDKNPDKYRGLIQLACALLGYRRLHAQTATRVSEIVPKSSGRVWAVLPPSGCACR